MPERARNPEHVIVNMFEQTDEGMHALRTSLPPDALQSLAREVVTKLEQRFREKRPDGPLPRSSEIDELCNALLSEDRHAAASLIASRLLDGVSIFDARLYHLAVAARRLGQWWEEDRVSFTDVTVATGRIYAILRTLRQLTAVPRPKPNLSALFASLPDNQHTLGVVVAADLFRDEGWEIDLLIDASHEAVLEEFARLDTHIVGISAGNAPQLNELLRLMVALRIQDPFCVIMVSGNIVNEVSNLQLLTGADAVASNFDEAMTEMLRFARGEEH